MGSEMLSSRANPQNTGIFEGPGLPELHGLKWSQELPPDSTYERIYVWNDMLCHTDDEGLHGLDLDTGEEKWSLPMPGLSQSALSAAGSLIYIVHPEGLSAFDDETGEERWRFETSLPSTSTAPVAAKGLVIFRNIDHLFALNAETGAGKWKRLFGAGFVAPASLSEELIVVSGAHGPAAFRIADGENVWTGSSAEGSISIVGDMVFGVGEMGVISCRSLRDGERVWYYGFPVKTARIPWWERFLPGRRPKRAAPSHWLSFPVVTAERIFFGSECGNVYALDRETREEVWRYKTEGMPSAISMAGGVLYFGGKETLHAVEAASGEKLWGFEAEGEIRSGPIVHRDRICFVGMIDYWTGTMWRRRNKVFVLH